MSIAVDSSVLMHFSLSTAAHQTVKTVMAIKDKPMDDRPEPLQEFAGVKSVLEKLEKLSERSITAERDILNVCERTIIELGKWEEKLCQVPFSSFAYCFSVNAVHVEVPTNALLLKEYKTDILCVADHLERIIRRAENFEQIFFGCLQILYKMILTCGECLNVGQMDFWINS